MSSDADGVVYLYENVGIGSAFPVVGSVVFELTDDYGVAYLYENVT